MKNKFVVIIPARYASTRLSGKPLKKIGDKSLIQHVCQRAEESIATEVIVATDDQRILDHVELSGFKAVLTSENCQSGTDRIAEAVKILELDDQTTIVNLQGDEPFMPADVINQMATSLIENSEAVMSTGCERLKSVKDYTNPDIVKVVRDKNDLALYFSRSYIPFSRNNNEQTVYKHLGIYAYRAGYVKHFASLNPCELELTEKLEQLRVLWHGDKIVVKEVTQATGIGVDTPADLELARKYYAQ